MGWIEDTRERFPRLFELHADWDFSCGDGWQVIVVDLCERLDALDLPELKIVQIKQKFGGLRVYARGGTDESSALTQAAEMAAWATCEDCGAPGKRSSVQGWFGALCDECRRKRDPDDRPQKQEPTLESQVAALPPKEAAKALLEAQIQILVEEALAKSALAGVRLDTKEVRRALLICLAREWGLL